MTQIFSISSQHFTHISFTEWNHSIIYIKQQCFTLNSSGNIVSQIFFLWFEMMCPSIQQICLSLISKHWHCSKVKCTWQQMFVTILYHSYCGTVAVTKSLLHSRVNAGVLMLWCVLETNFPDILFNFFFTVSISPDLYAVIFLKIINFLLNQPSLPATHFPSSNFVPLSYFSHLPLIMLHAY